MRVPKSKSLRLALLLILGSAIPALAQNATLTVSPASPTTDDVVTLTVSGQWPDACSPDRRASSTLTRQGTHVNVLFVFGGSGECAAVTTPWSETFNLGKLPAGSYEAGAALSRTLFPAQLLGTATFTVSAPQLVHVFVPSFYAAGDVSIGSRLSAFNNGEANASIALVAAYDASGRTDLSETPLALAPGASASVTTQAPVSGTIRFVEVATTTHVALRGALERLTGDVSDGRVSLPVFAAPFPAGSAVAAGDVSLRAGFRRANLTLFNAGDAEARFTVTVTSDQGVSLGTHDYVLDAQSVRQVNALILAATASGSSAWIRITADQPFLAYASAIYDDAAPGTIPYEILPAKTEF